MSKTLERLSVEELKGFAKTMGISGAQSFRKKEPLMEKLYSHFLDIEALKDNKQWIAIKECLKKRIIESDTEETKIRNMGRNKRRTITKSRKNKDKSGNDRMKMTNEEISNKEIESTDESIEKVDNVLQKPETKKRSYLEVAKSPAPESPKQKEKQKEIEDHRIEVTKTNKKLKRKNKYTNATIKDTEIELVASPEITTPEFVTPNRKRKAEKPPRKLPTNPNGKETDREDSDLGEISSSSSDECPSDEEWQTVTKEKTKPLLRSMKEEREEMKRTMLNDDKTRDLIGHGKLFAREAPKEEKETRKKEMTKTFKVSKLLQSKTRLAALPPEILRDFEKNRFGRDILKGLDKLQYRTQDVQTLNTYLLHTIDSYTPVIMDSEDPKLSKELLKDLYDDTFDIVAAIQRQLNAAGETFYKLFRKDLLNQANRRVDTAFLRDTKDRASVINDKERKEWEKNKKAKTTGNGYRGCFSQASRNRSRFKGGYQSHQKRPYVPPPRFQQSQGRKPWNPPAERKSGKDWKK